MNVLLHINAGNIYNENGAPIKCIKDLTEDIEANVLRTMDFLKMKKRL